MNATPRTREVTQTIGPHTIRADVVVNEWTPRLHSFYISGGDVPTTPEFDALKDAACWVVIDERARRANRTAT